MIMNITSHTRGGLTYFARLGYSVPMSLFNFELPKLVDEDDEEEDPDGLDDLDEASTVHSKTMVVKVTSNDHL